MSDSADNTENENNTNVDLTVVPPKMQSDPATISGLVLTFALIVMAILIGQSNANFLNLPGLMIVVLGTITVTMISYSMEEMKMAWQVVARTFTKRVQDPSEVARQLMDMAVIAKKKGLLSLSNAEGELSKDPFLFRATQLVTDGHKPEEVESLLALEIDKLAERHRRSAGILRRAAEVAPAMGLIGTLIGLVQMLADLDNPAAIGPAMALALLTTFYGAVFGTIVLAPMAGKLENNSNDETLIKSLILTAMSAIARQENPRRLELLLNSELQPSERIHYYE